MSRVLRGLLLGVGVGLAAMVSERTAVAATYTVTSISALQTRINAAVAGDVIILQNGVYTTSAAITVTRGGTASNPITIKAQTDRGAEIRGTHGFTVSNPATSVRIEGFLLTHQSGRNAIGSGATHITFARNVFQCTGDGAYLTIAGDDAEIDHKEFRNKSTVGNMIDVRGSGSQVAQRVWIHHNYFHDFTNAGANGAETIRFGLSGLSLSNGFGIVEHNLFVRCNGENELISNKSSSNTYRYNTILDSPGTQLTIRHGNDCLVYGNYLKNTDGIRIFGDRHQVFSNYLEGNTIGINIGNGDGEVADGAPLTSHDRPDNTVIAFNTSINNATHYVMSGRTNGLGATNTTFSNNILQGGAFNNVAFANQTGPFTAEFDATPSASPIDSYVALSQGAQTAHTGFAAIARFNPTGQIDARDGGAYAADTVLPYSGGVRYHFRLVVNVPIRTYSIFVTPAGGSEVTLGSNFSFRSEQSGVTSLSSRGIWAGAGSSSVCAFVIH